MKILVVCQYYYPEPFRISDICEALVQQGHAVTVVTGTPNYPEGIIYPGYEKGQHGDEVINGVRVHRCPLIPRKTGALYRFLNYYSFVFSSRKYLLGMKETYDVVFVNQLSPVMMAQGALAWAKRRGKKCVLYCLDLWPESLLVGGVRKDSAIYKVFMAISKKIYRKADAIAVSSKAFIDYFETVLGIPGVIAVILRCGYPPCKAWTAKLRDVSLGIWIMNLTIIAGVGTQRVLAMNIGWWDMLPLVIGSLVVCVTGFVAGYRLGGRGLKRECSQCLGQKNTILTLYIASQWYVHPLAYIGPAFYVFFHNIANALQIALANREKAKSSK